MNIRKFVTVVFVLVISGCAAKAPPYNPFQIEEQAFRERVHTIALVQIRVPTDVPDPEGLKRKFEGMITARLQQFGYLMLPSGDAGKIMERVRAESGGAFDPLTGKEDAAKAEQIRQKALAEIAARHHADAVLYSSIYVVRANFRNGVAAWDGISERIETGGSATVRALGGMIVEGTVPASTVGVILEDIHGTKLYSKGGGIESLVTWGSVSGMLPKPLPQLFQNDTRNQKAVDMAMAELDPNPPPLKK